MRTLSTCLASSVLLFLSMTATFAFAEPEWSIVKAKPIDILAGDHKDYIPKQFGRLVSVQANPAKGASPFVTSWLWFEGSDGTVRLVQVNVAGAYSNGVFIQVIEFPRR